MMVLVIFHEKEILEIYVELQQVDHTKNKQTNTDTEMKKKKSYKYDTACFIRTTNEFVLSLKFKAKKKQDIKGNR